MPSTVTLEALRELASFRAAKGCAISLYVDLDPQVAINPGDIKARVNSLLDAGGRNGGFDANAMTREQKVAFRDDIERIKQYFADELDRSGARGFALFCSSLDNLFQPLPLASGVVDDVRVGRELYLAPLVPVVGRGEGALVAAIGRERGQLFRLRVSQRFHM